MTPDRYSGDPRLMLKPNGWTLDYEGGQPIMDQGLENQVLLSLMVDDGWCGNLFLPPAQRIGSAFRSTCANPITLQAINADIPNAASLALKSSLFPSVAAAVANPNAWNLKIAITIGSGEILTLDRRGMLWSMQAKNPASARLVKKA